MSKWSRFWELLRLIYRYVQLASGDSEGNQSILNYTRPGERAFGWYNPQRTSAFHGKVQIDMNQDLLPLSPTMTRAA